MSAQNDLLLFAASEEEINQLCEGVVTGYSVPWPSPGITRIKPEHVGALVRRLPDKSKVRPAAIIVRREDQRRLFGRFSSLHGDFSPLTAWCHVLEPQLFDVMDGPTRVPSFYDFEASWCGLAIAEASFLAERSVDTLRVASCFATASFAVARSFALWPQYSLNEILDRYQECNKSIRGAAAYSQSVQKLIPLWRTLIAVSKREPHDDLSVARLMLALHDARSEGQQDEAAVLWRNLDHATEFSFLPRLAEIGPEDRVGLFDHLLNELSSAKANKREIFAFLAGYITTIAAGGLPSLSLAEEVSGRFPEVLSWAYVIGGIGEQLTWSSSFHGLGRLICRELERPFHLDEAPQCDFGFDESSCLIDRQLNDPYVHLKIKQQRLLSVAILPGVHISVTLQDNQKAKSSVTSKEINTKASRENLKLLDQLWPLIEARLQNEGYLSGVDKGGGSNVRRKGQARLPLDR